MVTKDRHIKPGLEQKKTGEMTDNEKLSLELTEKSPRCNLKATQEDLQRALQLAPDNFSAAE